MEVVVLEADLAHADRSVATIKRKAVGVANPMAGMLASWQEVEVKHTADGLGLIVDGSNNTIQDVIENGAGDAAGILAGSS